VPFAVPVRRLGIGLLIIAPALWAAPVEQSISTSRQFIVYGTDLAMRGVICDFAERTKRDLLNLLEQPDDWATTIVINAQYPQANVPELPRLSVNLGQTGFGLKLQLDLVVDSKAGGLELRREIFRALVLEMAYRAQPRIPAGTVYRSPPDWLLEGVPGLQSDLPRDRVTSILAVPAAAKNVLSLEKFLVQRPELLDAPGQLLHRAYSFALVDLLRHAPDGPRRLKQLIVDLPSASNDPVEELRSHFPGLLDANPAEEIWQEQIVRLSTHQPYELMGSAETERVLEEKLRLNVSDRGATRTYELSDFPVFVKQAPARKALGSLAKELSALAVRANPVYAEMVAEYANLVTRLAHGKTIGVARRLHEVERARQTLSAQMREVDDYLNWFEATNLGRPSGQFGSYLRAAERAAQREPNRRDPISVYLDALESQFEN
jgi:hypothetical protein